MTYVLSPSRLGLLKECPRCFWLHFTGALEGNMPELGDCEYCSWVCKVNDENKA